MAESPLVMDRVDQDRVRDAIERIVRCPPFSGSPRLCEFLSYIVDHSLRGDLSELKEVCIGTAVFGKPSSYDPKIEPIVRVEARRLRARLEDYYAQYGQSDPIRIRLPKGGYQVLFEENCRAVSQVAPHIGEESRLDSTEFAPSPVLGAAPAPARQLGQHGSGRFRKILLLVAVAAFSVGIGVVLVVRMAVPKPLHFNRIMPLTSDAGTELQPAISHDGKQVVFVWSGENDDNFDIYVKLLDVGTPVRVTTDPAHDLAPQWSPDDRFLAFERVSEQGIGIYVVPALGGAERKIADLHMPVEVWKPDATQIQVGSGTAWTADGRGLIVSDQETATSGPASLYVLPLDGAPRRRLTHPPVPAGDFNAVISPNGRSVAFLRETSNSAGDLYVSDLDGGNARQITFDRSLVRGIAWTPNGRSLVFASNRGGKNELWQISVRGGTPEKISTAGDEVTYPALSSDGTILAYTAATQNSNIWRLSLHAPRGPTQPVPNLLIASKGRNDSPRYSPDGKKIAFVSDRSGSWEIWICDSDGKHLRQMTNFGGPMVGTPHWSPDSRSIVFDARPNGRSVIYTVSLEGAGPRLAVDDGFEDKKPNWSRDGRSVYYTSNRNGAFQLWRSGVHGENPARLTDIPCNDSVESPDGKLIYFQNDGYGIYRMPVAGGKPILVHHLENVYPSRFFDVSSKIYFLDQENTPRRIREYDPETGTISMIGTISGQLVYGTPSLSVSADGRFLLFAQEDKSSSEILTLRK